GDGSHCVSPCWLGVGWWFLLYYIVLLISSGGRLGVPGQSSLTLTLPFAPCSMFLLYYTSAMLSRVAGEDSLGQFHDVLEGFKCLLGILVDSTLFPATRHVEDVGKRLGIHSLVLGNLTVDREALRVAVNDGEDLVGVVGVIALTLPHAYGGDELVGNLVSGAIQFEVLPAKVVMRHGALPCCGWLVWSYHISVSPLCQALGCTKITPYPPP